MTANVHQGRSPSTAEADTLGEIDQLCCLADSLGTNLDVQALVERSLEPLLSLAGATRAVVYLGTEDDGNLRPTAHRDWSVASSVAAAEADALGPESKGYDGAENLPRSLATVLADNPGPIAIAPLRVHSRLLGMVVFGRAEGAFGDATLKLLTAGGRTLALAIENSSLFEDLQTSYRQLMSTQEELIRSERMAALGQLSATLAHEIRNPLATIFSALSQIRKHGRSDDVLDTLLDIAEEEAARLNNMVTGLLDFARPRKPVFENGRPLEIAREVIRAIAEAEPLPEGTELTIADDTDDPTVRLDRDLIQKALTHLVVNGLNAVEHEGGRVAIAIRHPEGRPTGAIIEVRDNGPGISQELLPKVVEPFFSTNPSGTGLGLPTVKRIAEDHRGTMEIDSRPGTGTLVRLLIEGGGTEPLEEEMIR